MARDLQPPPLMPKIDKIEDAERYLKGVFAYLDLLRQQLMQAFQDLITTSTVFGVVHPGTASGVTGTNNTGTPTTKWDVSVGTAVLAKSDNSALKRVGPFSGTVDITVAGPAANGRDQAGAFATNSFVHIFVIAKEDGTTALLASASTTPTLPTDYVYRAQISTLRLDGSTQFLRMTQRGPWIYYDAANTDGFMLNGGTATTETAVDLSTRVPSFAQLVELVCLGNYQNASANQFNQWFIRVQSGQEFAAVNRFTTQVANQDMTQSMSIVVPNINQNIFYYWFTNAGTRNANIYVMGYRMPFIQG